MSKLKKLNKLNKSKTLSVALSVGLIASNLATVVPAYAATPTSAVHNTIVHAANPRISPTSSTFDKYEPRSKDIKVTVALNGNTLDGITNGDYDLAEGSDYDVTFTSNEKTEYVTLSSSYMSQLDTGINTLTFNFDNGSALKMRLTVRDTTPAAKISPASSTFDKNESKQKDIVVKMTPNSHTLNGILNGNHELEADNDYIVEDNTVTINSSYLATLSNGTTYLTFDFDSGIDPRIKITVKDTSPSSKLKGSAATFDNKKGGDVVVNVIPAGDNTLDGITNTTTGNALTENDYSVENEETVTIFESYLAKLANGTNTFAFDFSKGTDPTFRINVRNSSAVTLKSIAASNGEITATLSGTPDTDPVADDFVVTQTIDNGDPEVITPTDVTTDGKVSTITVDPVVATAADQKVVYSVSYNSGKAQTASFTVKADDQAPIIKAAEDAIAAYVAAPLTSPADVTAAQALEAAARAAVDKVTDAATKASLTAEIDAQKAVVDAAAAEFNDEDIATAAVTALETAANADLTVEANLTAAEAAVTAANAAMANVDAGTVKDALQARIDAAAQKVTDARAAFDLAQKVTAATNAVVALETATADLSTQALVDAANALVAPAEDAIKALPDGNANIATLTARVDTAKAAIAAAQVKLMGIVSVTGVNNITVDVAFNKVVDAASLKASDFVFDNGLTVSAAKVLADTKTVELTTSAQDATKTYKLAYQNKDTGLSFVGVAPVPLNVDTVTVGSKTAISVILKDDTTAATDKSSYIVKIGDQTVTVASVDYVKELKKATLTVDLSGTQGRVSVNGIAASADVDYKAPTVNAITPLTETTFYVEYSEDVDNVTATAAGNYSIVQKGTANVFTIFKVEAVAGLKNKVKVTTNSALTVGTSYTLGIKNVKDLSANVIADNTNVDFTAAKDATRPTLVSVTALDSNKVQVVLSKDVDPASITKDSVVIKPYKADGTLDAALLIAAAPDVAGGTLTVNLPDASLLTNGQKYNLSVVSAKDFAGNLIADTQAADFLGVSDTTQPTVTGSALDSGKLTVSFSEAVNIAGATFKVFDPQTGLEVGGAVTATVLAPDKKSVQLTLAAGLAKTTATTYALRINGVVDLSKAANPIVANTIVNFTVPAVTVTIDLTSATDVSTQQANMLKLAFNSAVSKAEAENIANYSIAQKDDATKTLAVTKAVLADDGLSVTLTTAFQDQVTYTVKVANLSNLDTDATKTKADFAGKDILAPTLVSVNPIDLSYVDLQFSEKLKAVQDQLKIYVMPADDPAAIVSNLTAPVGITPTVSGSGNVLRLQFAKDLIKGKNYTIQVVGVKDLQGNYQTNDVVVPAPPVSTTSSFTAVEDLVAPQLTKVTAVNSATLLLDFNKEVAAAGGTGNYVIHDTTTGKDVGYGAGAVVTITGDGNTEVQITNKDAGGSLVQFLTNGDQYTLTINGGVTDLAGNTVTTLTSTFIGVDDKISPKLVSVTDAPVATNVDGVMNTQVTLNFDEQITANVADLTKFVVTNTATFDRLTVASAKLGDDKKSVLLTLSTPTTTNQQYRVYISDTSIIKDVSVSQNQLDSTTVSATFTGVDTSAPTLSNMKLTGKTAAGTATAATIAVTALDGANKGTIAVSGLVDGATYTAGDFKLSEDVVVTFDAVQDKYDVIKDTPIPVSQSTSGSALISLLSVIFNTDGGVTTSNLKANTNSHLYLKDAVGNKTDYTLTATN